MRPSLIWPAQIRIDSAETRRAADVRHVGRVWGVQNARKMPDTRRKRCAAASRCTNFESVPDRHGKRRRCGKRMRGARYEVTACGNVVCCELVHAEECEVRVAVVQCRVPSLRVKQAWSCALPAFCVVNARFGIIEMFAWAGVRSVSERARR